MNEVVFAQWGDKTDGAAKVIIAIEGRRRCHQCGRWLPWERIRCDADYHGRCRDPYDAGDGGVTPQAP